MEAKLEEERFGRFTLFPGDMKPGLFPTTSELSKSRFMGVNRGRRAALIKGLFIAHTNARCWKFELLNCPAYP